MRLDSENFLKNCHWVKVEMLRIGFRNSRRIGLASKKVAVILLHLLVASFNANAIKKKKVRKRNYLKGKFFINRLFV